MNKKNWFKRIKNVIYIILIGSFLIIYAASESGYFDEIKNRRVALTKEQIAKFEEDISLGREINVDEYYIDNSNVYNNKFTKLGIFLSTKIENIVSKILDKSFKALNDFLNS